MKLGVPGILHGSSGETFVGKVEVEKIVHRNPNDGWTVLRFKQKGRIFTGTGVMPDLLEGDPVELEGTWEENNRFGLQVKVRSYQATLPQTGSGTVRWLAARLPNIGSKKASLLVDHFGDDLWRVISEEPARLAEVHGISEVMAESIAKAYEKFESERAHMVWMMGLGLPDRAMTRILSLWGHNARSRIEENPYQIQDLEGCDFMTADRVAMALGRPRDSRERLDAALGWYVARESFGSGSTITGAGPAILAAANTCGGHLQAIQDLIFAPTTEWCSVRVVRVGLDHLALATLNRAERSIALSVHRLLAFKEKVEEVEWNDDEQPEFYEELDLDDEDCQHWERWAAELEVEDD